MCNDGHHLRARASRRKRVHFCAPAGEAGTWRERLPGAHPKPAAALGGPERLSGAVVGASAAEAPTGRATRRMAVSVRCRRDGAVPYQQSEAVVPVPPARLGSSSPPGPSLVRAQALMSVSTSSGRALRMLPARKPPTPRPCERRA